MELKHATNGLNLKRKTRRNQAIRRRIMKQKRLLKQLDLLSVDWCCDCICSYPYSSSIDFSRHGTASTRTRTSSPTTIPSPSRCSTLVPNRSQGLLVLLLERLQLDHALAR